MGEMGESGRRRKQASELSAGVLTGGPRHTILVGTPGEGDTRSQTSRLCSRQTQPVPFPACLHTSGSSDWRCHMTSCSSLTFNVKIDSILVANRLAAISNACVNFCFNTAYTTTVALVSGGVLF